MSGEQSALEKECAEITEKAARSPSITIRLSMPVKFNSIETNEIKLRRMTVGDQIEYNKAEDTQEATVNLIAKLAGVNPEEVRAMDAVDAQVCDAAIAGFLKGRPKGG